VAPGRAAAAWALPAAGQGWGLLLLQPVSVPLLGAEAAKRLLPQEERGGGWAALRRRQSQADWRRLAAALRGKALQLALGCRPQAQVLARVRASCLAAALAVGLHLLPCLLLLLPVPVLGLAAALLLQLLELLGDVLLL
jgi:hypothetical protein